jgi:hypothetical protein
MTYDEQTYKEGQKQGKAEVERLDRIRGTDIKKILQNNKGIRVVDKYIKSNVCPLPWTHLEVDVNGGASPCCLYKGSVPDVKVYKQSLKNIQDSEYMSNLREQFRKGERPSRLSELLAGRRCRQNIERDRIPYTK